MHGAVNIFERSNRVGSTCISGSSNTSSINNSGSNSSSCTDEIL